MDLEKAKQIINQNREKKLTDSQIQEVLALAEMLADCIVNNLKTASLK
jgi:hypothetical protein